MRTRSCSLNHPVDFVRRTVLVGLVIVDTLGIRKTGFQSFQRLEPTKIIINGSIQCHVIGRVTAIISRVLQNIICIILVSILLTIAWSISSNRQAVDIFWYVIRTSQQQVIILLVVCTTYFNIWLVLLAIVSAYLHRGFHPFADMKIHASPIIPTVIFHVTQITILFEIAHVGVIVCLVRSTTHIDTMFLCETSIPIFVKQIVVQGFHCLNFISLEKIGSQVERSVLWVCSSNSIIQTSIVVCAQHLGMGNSICQTELTRI